MVSVPAVVEPPTDLPLPVLLLVLGLRDHEVVDAALVVVAGLVRRVLKVSRKNGLKLYSEQKNLKTKILRFSNEPSLGTRKRTTKSHNSPIDLLKALRE